MYIASFVLFWESSHQNLVSVYYRAKRSHYFWKKNILF